MPRQDKRRAKKLALDKKTLRRLTLDERQLQQVAGGALPLWSRGRPTTSDY